MTALARSSEVADAGRVEGRRPHSESTTNLVLIALQLIFQPVVGVTVLINRGDKPVLSNIGLRIGIAALCFISAGLAAWFVSRALWRRRPRRTV